MQKLNDVTAKIMQERFGKDNIISLATVDNRAVPYVRSVNAFYENEAFYVITHGLSRKMQHIAKNSTVAISGDWFTAHGRGENLGWFCSSENTEIAEKLKKAFSSWINNDHNNFSDPNTCILSIQLTDGILFSHGTRYDIDFTK